MHTCIRSAIFRVKRYEARSASSLSRITTFKYDPLNFTRQATKPISKIDKSITMEPGYEEASQLFQATGHVITLQRGGSETNKRSNCSDRQDRVRQASCRHLAQAGPWYCSIPKARLAVAVGRVPVESWEESAESERLEGIIRFELARGVQVSSVSRTRDGQDGPNPKTSMRVVLLGKC